ncbi:MAG: hypothetical protein FJX94_09385 [Bacteroidetes bacterium]|nr:hypothetical protein [Bacteroidota bacterium]
MFVLLVASAAAAAAGPAAAAAVHAAAAAAPLLDSSAAAALTKHLRHTLSVCMNQTHALGTQMPHCKWLHPGQYL